MQMSSMRAMSLSPGRRLVGAVIAALGLLLAVPSAAAPAGEIVVFGADSGSTLTITPGPGRIVVEGNMSRRSPQGCQLTVGHRVAVCPLEGEAAMEVDMGPSGDFVRVARSLPFPLTVHLGGGSDKFIGNGEIDTCYSEGARRNRCVGGPGNDECITGQQNSDCVGGAGNDYCRTGAGSDGCWGGPGNDICSMGPGEDGCHGESGADRLYGGPGADQLYGGGGNDYCNGGPGIGKSHECPRGPGH